MTKSRIRSAIATLSLLWVLMLGAPDVGALGVQPALPAAADSELPGAHPIVVADLSAKSHRANRLTPSEFAPGRTEWLSRDPLGERGGLNLYAFVDNDPVNRYDYLGLNPYHSHGARRGDGTVVLPSRSYSDTYYSGSLLQRMAPGTFDHRRMSDPGYARHAIEKAKPKQLAIAVPIMTSEAAMLSLMAGSGLQHLPALTSSGGSVATNVYVRAQTLAWRGQAVVTAGGASLSAFYLRNANQINIAAAEATAGFAGYPRPLYNPFSVLWTGGRVASMSDEVAEGAGRMLQRDEVFELAERVGVNVADDVYVRLLRPEHLDEGVNGTWGIERILPGQQYRWEGFFGYSFGSGVPRGEKIIVSLNREQGLAQAVGSLAHELHELEGMRRIFQNTDVLSAEKVYGLLNTSPIRGAGGLLHEEALKVEAKAFEAALDLIKL